MLKSVDQRLRRDEAFKWENQKKEDFIDARIIQLLSQKVNAARVDNGFVKNVHSLNKEVFIVMILVSALWKKINQFILSLAGKFNPLMLTLLRIWGIKKNMHLFLLS